MIQTNTNLKLEHMVKIKALTSCSSIVPAQKAAPPLDSQSAGLFVHSLRSLLHKNPITLPAA